MRQVSVRGDLLRIPKMCCCCGQLKAKNRYKAEAKRTGQWVNTRYWEKRSWEFPICTRCHRWTRAEQTAASAMVLFIGSAVMAVVAGVLGLVTLDMMLGMLALVLAGCLALIAIVALVIWQSRRVQARSLDPGPPCDRRPVVLTDWLRDKHTFRFANEEYCDQFSRANREAVV